MAMKLYGANVCPFVHRVRLLLAEKRIVHEYVAIDLANKPDWYHDVLPTGRVPLLEHNGHRIWESGIVCEFLEEAFLSPSFMPEDPGARAMVRLTLQWISNNFVPPFYKLLAAQDLAKQDEYRQELMKALESLEERLSESSGPYLHSQLSLADVELYPWFERWCVLEHYRKFKVPEELEAVHRWISTLEKRDAVKELREKDEFFIHQYRRYADGSVVPS